jgi:hypothetical protein
MATGFAERLDCGVFTAAFVRANRLRHESSRRNPEIAQGSAGTTGNEPANFHPSLRDLRLLISPAVIAG